MKVVVIMALAFLSACSWFGSRKHEAPDPTELIVTGAPEGSIVFIDGLPAGQASVVNDRPQVISVAVGVHKVEIHMGGKVVYREDTYVALSEHRVVTVLSGLTR